MAKAKIHPDQAEIPGAEQEDEKIQPIITAAKRYESARDQRIDAGKDEKSAKESLIEVMKKHNRTSYRYGGIAVYLDNKEEVQVKKVSKPAEANGDGE